MQRHKRGFLLVGWMVQCSLLIFMSLISYSLIVNWYKVIIKVQQSFTDIVPVYLACDQLLIDLHHADTMAISDNVLTLVKGDKNIKWYSKDYRLMRAISTFNFHNNYWKAPTVSLMSQKIKLYALRQIFVNERSVYVNNIMLMHIDIEINQLIILRKGLML